jgi:ribosomal protein S27E
LPELYEGDNKVSRTADPISERERGNEMNKCRYCKQEGLVLSTINVDYSCEYCGKWQNAFLDSVWNIEGYIYEESV